MLFAAGNEVRQLNAEQRTAVRQAGELARRQNEMVFHARRFRDTRDSVGDNLDKDVTPGVKSFLTHFKGYPFEVKMDTLMDGMEILVVVIVLGWLVWLLFSPPRRPKKGPLQDCAEKGAAVLASSADALGKVADALNWVGREVEKPVRQKLREEAAARLKHERLGEAGGAQNGAAAGPGQSAAARAR